MLPDDDFSLRNEYEVQIVGVLGAKKETVVSSYEDFVKLIPPALWDNEFNIIARDLADEIFGDGAKYLRVLPVKG